MSATQPRAGSQELFADNGEMAALINTLDWSQTPLGAASGWSQSLKSLVKTLLTSRYPMILTWGPDFTQIYNDAYSHLIGDKHPAALGIDIRITLAEAWDTLGPMIETVMATGVANWTPALPLILERSGYREESYFSVSHAPAEDDTGHIVGMLAVCSEVTEQVLGERRLRLLRDLSAKAGGVQSVEATCQDVIATIAQSPMDVPFALLYLRDSDSQTLTLQGIVGLPANLPLSPAAVELGTDAADFWSLTQASSGETVFVEAVDRHITVLGGVLNEPVRSALVMPIASSKQTAPLGVLVAGISPNRALDEGYRSFYELLAAQVSVLVRNAQAYDEERQRAETLAELDRAKTIFFSNISHEFRTPLTLMLDPLETLSHQLDGRLSDTEREQLQMIQRNGSRLLKLVNTLLDFSRIEAGRVEAVYEPIDLSIYTAELASVFRSAIESAGMQLTIDCPALPESVYVDREMWEKIVLNLISNAFKFTFSGEIKVSLDWQESQVALSVADTGIGISMAELPRLFDRFYRVEGSRGRTYEGSGIGLSLVQELVKLHGGTIEVTSVVDQGTTFTVTIPTGTAHLPTNRIQATSTLTSTAIEGSAYLNEALRWLPQSDIQKPESKAREALPAHILLVDDNADMRDYVSRLLSEQYEVEAVADGKRALEAVDRKTPDLVLTDVMMPELDGFQLLQALRSDPQTRDIPIIMLSARAGEDARIEGLSIGADDYLVKPFSARELLASVEANLQQGRLRREALRDSEDRLRLAIESAELGTWDFNPTTGALTWDEGCKAMFGLPPDAEISYDVFLAGLHPVDRDRMHHVVQSVLDPATGGKLDVEFRTIGIEDGVERWIAAKGQAYFNFAGKAVRLIGTVLNVTAKKAAEVEREALLAEAEAAREQAETANRLKDEFLAVLSHELRTPLNPILGWTRLLRMGGLDAQTRTSALETIERNAKLQTHLIEDLLDISRILQGKFTLNAAIVDLAATFRAAQETVRLAAEAKAIQIQTVFAPQMQPIVGDANRLQQVFWNLLSNAVKFTPAGGRIEARLEFTLTHAQIQVKDNGTGIRPEFLPHVFDYFRQADGATTRKFGGLGLGLAIARRIVELHGGTIQAESAGEGQGATFTVSLPVAQDSTTIHAGKDSNSIHSTDCPLEGIRVFVVDDETDTRDLIVFVLEQAGASVTAAPSAVEALQALQQLEIDVLLSDIGMPDMDGYMLMQQLKSQRMSQKKQIPASSVGVPIGIALTAHAGELDQQQAVAAGFQKHLSKPIEPEELVRVITNLTARMGV